MSKRTTVAQDADGNSIAKAGKGDLIFLAFVGRRRRSEDIPELSAKSDPANDLVGLLVLLLFGGMICVVLWRLIAGAL